MKIVNGIPHFGHDKPYQGKEDNLQITVARWLAYKKPYPLWWHTPNGGARDAREGAKFKRMGVKKGVPDVVILEPIHTYSGIAIELKVKGGKVTKEQREFLIAMEERGFFVAVCWNIDSVVQVVDSYLSASWHYIQTTTL